MPCPANIKPLLTSFLLAACSFTAAAEPGGWRVHTDIDLFAFSEVVSIDQFATDFKGKLIPGDNAFTHDKFEFGVQYRGLSLAYVDRFDYITEFTQDTALFHHSTKNGIVLPTNRKYRLRLDVERVRAQGVRVGYDWAITDDLTIGVAGTHYYQTSDLQSGFASAAGDLEPITDELITRVRAITENLRPDNRDLSPLVPLVADVQLEVLIDYAYDEPKFREPFYRKPVLVGAPNAVISGVNFTDEPQGSGYSYDLVVDWRATDRLFLRAEFLDLGYEINWVMAPRTQASFGLNAALIDAIGVAQEFVNGERVSPNNIVDRHLFVDIANSDFDQSLPWRADFSAEWQLDYELPLPGWHPALSVKVGYHHTEVMSFPRFGLGIGNHLSMMYDTGGKSLLLRYQGKYGFASIVADRFDTKKAHTLGIALGIQYGF